MQSRSDPPVPRHQLTDRFVDASLGPLRQHHLDAPVRRLAPQTEADEVSLLESCDRAFDRVHLEPQPGLDEVDHAGHHTLAAPLASGVDAAPARGLRPTPLSPQRWSYARSSRATLPYPRNDGGCARSSRATPPYPQRAASDASCRMPARKAAGGSAGQGGACRVQAGLGRQRADNECARELRMPIAGEICLGTTFHRTKSKRFLMSSFVCAGGWIGENGFYAIHGRTRKFQQIQKVNQPRRDRRGYRELRWSDLVACQCTVTLHVANSVGIGVEEKLNEQAPGLTSFAHCHIL